MGCYIWYSEKGPGLAAAALPSPLLAVPNVTAHPSTASVQINVLLCGFNVVIKGLKMTRNENSVLANAECGIYVDVCCVTESLHQLSGCTFGNFGTSTPLSCCFYPEM